VKRAGNLYADIAAPENLRLAFWKASRGKRDKPDVVCFCERLDSELAALAAELAAGSVGVGAYRYFTIHDPKERVICAASFRERVLHHAIINRCEPAFESYQISDSYACRKDKGTYKVLDRAQVFAGRYRYSLKLDVRKYLDAIPHDLVERAVAHHTDLPWVRLYVARWLRAPVQRPDGTLQERTKGTPQGGVASPLLANLFLHYAFDFWMQRNFPSIQFERYADDAIVHCRSEGQARTVLGAIRGRFEQCGLELHPMKTRIVYCKDDDRPGDFEPVAFDFLGYTFQPRRAKNHRGKFFVSFLPAISTKAAKAIRKTIREWRMASTRNNQSLEDLARLVNPSVRGWMNYYGRFYRSKCVQVLRHLNEALAAWARRKYKRFRRRERASTHWLGRIAQRDPNLFVLWQLGVKPEAGG